MAYRNKHFEDVMGKILAVIIGLCLAASGIQYLWQLLFN
jgi:hypothetical protein